MERRNTTLDINLCSIYTYAVSDLSFNGSAYSIEESDRSVQFTLLLSIPSSFDITVQVLSINVLASGECVIAHCYCK